MYVRPCIFQGGHRPWLGALTFRDRSRAELIRYPEATLHSPSASAKRTCWLPLRDHRPPFPTSGPVVTTAPTTPGQRPPEAAPAEHSVLQKENIYYLFFSSSLEFLYSNTKERTNSADTRGARGPLPAGDQLEAPLRLTQTARPLSSFGPPCQGRPVSGPIPAAS